MCRIFAADSDGGQRTRRGVEAIEDLFNGLLVAKHGEGAPLGSSTQEAGNIVTLDVRSESGRCLLNVRSL